LYPYRRQWSPPFQHVLGLLISNANTSFTRLGGQVTALSAEILRLDHILRRYGADAEPARNFLLRYAEHKTDDLFPDDPTDVRLSNPSTYDLLQRLEDMLLALKPANPRDQWWLAQAMTLASKIGDTRWLIAQQIGQGTPKTFVALLVFWLALLFASFGLFAPPNLTSTVTLTLCALAVAGAVAMFVELEQGFGGLVRVSPEPMHQAVRTLEAKAADMAAVERHPHAAVAINVHAANALAGQRHLVHLGQRRFGRIWPGIDAHDIARMQ